MVPQERDLVTTLLERLKGTTGQPKDPEAEALIRQAMQEQPDAPYYLVQTVLIQDLSLHQAQNRIAELEKQVADAQTKPTSFLGNLFGSRGPAPPLPAPAAGPWTRGPQVAPPAAGPGYAQPGYAQPQQQGYAPAGGGMMGGGMMGGMGGGGGFLRSAAATAAGVAGGALLFEGISSLFGHGYASGLNGGMGMSPGLGETVVNNYYGDSGSGGGDYGGGSDAGGGDYGGGGDTGGGDYGGGGDSGGGDSGGGDYGGGGDDGGGGDYGGGGDTSC
ncbi:MAG TPA: DUF2076 domain-containing protein [Stellaceae bacterium]|nr:DUF2076 domain-containing protein [Stellaceae bacterium]